MSDVLSRLFSSIKKTVATNLPFVILIVILFGYLVVRGLPENRWNGWKCCSTQVLLTARFWARDGFLNHYILQINQGYGKTVRFFDEPGLQHHAHGTVAGNLLGAQKLYYTHYPSFYIIPIALLMKLGVNSLFVFKLLAIIASLFGLIFFYAFAKLISNKAVALIATLYFAVSPIFTGYADILEYLPLEDMLRFLIIFLSILFLIRLKLKKFDYYKTCLGTIWISYFLLSLTSYNSTVFIFIWLLGLTLICLWHAPINGKKLVFIFLTILWASAPILGFGMQLIQNAAYFGWRNVWLDIYGTFISVGNNANLDFLTRIEGIIRPLFSMTGIYNFYTLLTPLGIAKIKQAFLPHSIPLVYVLLLLVIPIIVAIVKIRKLKSSSWPSLSIMLLLIAAPLSQTLFLPLTGYRDWMSRLFAPFVGIIIGSITYNSFLIFKEYNLNFIKKFLIVLVFVFVMLLFIIQITLSYTQVVAPSNSPLSDSDITFSRYVKNIDSGEKAIFMINKRDISIDKKQLEIRKVYISPFNYFTDYMNWAYFFDAPLLNFIKTDDLVKDLLFLRKRAEFPFTAIITSDNKSLINEVYKKLNANRLPLKPIEEFENRYFFTISHYLNE